MLQQQDYCRLQEIVSLYTHMLYHVFSNISRDYSSSTRNLLNSTLLQGLTAVIADDVTSKLGNVRTPKNSGHFSIVTFPFKTPTRNYYLFLVFALDDMLGHHRYSGHSRSMIFLLRLSQRAQSAPSPANLVKDKIFGAKTHPPP